MDFLLDPHMKNGFVFLHTTKYLFYIVKTWKRLPENPEYAEMRHGIHFTITMTPQIGVLPACGWSFFYLSHGLVWVCEIELSHVNKHNGTPDLACEKFHFSALNECLLTGWFTPGVPRMVSLLSNGMVHASDTEDGVPSFLYVYARGEGSDETANTRARRHD